MPIYEITAPDGKTYEIEGPPGASRQDVINAILARNPLAAQPPAPPKEGIMAALTGGAKRFGSTLETGLESIIDPTLAAQRGTARQEAISQQYAPGASLEKVKRAYEEKGLFPAAYEAVSQVPSALAEQFPNIASSIGGARVGAMAGSPFGPAGALVGGIGGALAPSLLQLYGSGLERQAQEGVPEISRASALGAAIPGAAAEVASTFIPLGRNLIGKLLGPEAEKALARGTTQSIEAAAKETLTTSLAKGAGIGALAEIPTEVTQQMLERYQAGLPLTTPDALAEYGESAYGAALVGTPFGAAARGLGRPAAREAYANQLQLEQVKADQQRQRDAEAALQRAQAERTKTEEELGVSKMLALPAPAKAYEEPKNPLIDPVGRVTEDELGKAIGNNTVVNYLNRYRKDNNLPKLKSYSIEDIKDAMTAQNPEGEEGALNAILAYKTNYQNQSYTPDDIQNIAVAKNVATDTKGFFDFLTRATGKADLNTMTQPELHSVATALDALPRTGKEEQLVLPEGSNATRFTQDQYNTGLTTALGTIKPGKPVSLEQATKAVQAQTGLETDRDAESLLRTAVINDDLTIDRGTGYQAVSPTGAVLGTYGTESEAKRMHRRAEIKPVETELVTPRIEEAVRPEATLPEGYQIQKETTVGSEAPAAYVIREDGSQKNASQTFSEEADAKERLNILARKREANAAAEEAAADRVRQDLEKRQAAIAQMEADGKTGTPEHTKAVYAFQAANVAGSQKITDHLDKAEALRTPLKIVPLGKKSTKAEKHTVIKDGKVVASFDTNDKAQAHVLSLLDDKALESIAERGGVMGKRASVELDMRQRPGVRGATAEGLEKAGVRTPEVEAKLKELEKKLKPMLDKFGLGDVALKVVRAIEQNAEGSYIDKLIKIAFDAENPVRTMRHEAIHALKELGFFTPQQWKALEKQAKDVWIDKYLKGVPYNEEMSRFDAYKSMGLSDADIIEEAVADAFADFDQANKAPPGMLDALFKRLKEFFRALRQALSGAGFDSAEEIFGKIERGELVPRGKPVETIGERLSLLREAYPDETEISTQNPQGVKRVYDPITQMLSIDEAAVREAMKANPDMARRTIQAIKAYGFIPKDTKNKDVLKVFKRNIVNNLIFLYRSVPERIRQRSKLWYDGANKIATEMAAEFGTSMEQVAGIMAAMSPQKDWFQNVSMAERALDILTKHGDKAWDENMLKYADSYVKEAKDRKEREKRQDAFDKIKAVAAKGTKLKDMGIKEAAAFIRAYDEAYHSRNYRIVTPEGGFGDLVRNLDGKPSTLMWSTYGPIEKTVSIFRDGSRKNISQQLGFEHKIRSFYNNIGAPNSDISHVTIDTHAVAAGLFEALAGTDPEVAQNFGATGSSDVIGVGGTYGLIADAYREAAEKMGIKAREMQSITWEAVRGLFTEEMKSSIKPKIRAEWAKYKNGEQTFDETRAKVIEIAGGFKDPDWVGSGVGSFVENGGTSYDKSFVPEGGVRMREAQELRERLTFNLSAVTNSIPGLRELYQRAMGKDKEAYAVLQRVAESSLSYLLSGTNARVNVEYAKGVYLSDREPSISVQVSFDESESPQVLAALAKFAESYNQQQIHVRQPTIRQPGHEFPDGSYATVVYQIPLKKELSNVRISEIIEQSGLAGFTVTPDTLTAYWVKGDDNAESSFDSFEKQVTDVYGLVGAKDSKTRRTTERLYVYGEGYGAKIPYSQITGDIRPKQSSDTVTPKIIAEYLTGEPVTTFKQKPLTQPQVKEQELLADVFDELPLNDLKRPLVKKAYQALAKALKEQFAVLPIKVELVDSTAEPYANSAEMREDVSKNNRFRVYKTTPETFGPPGSNFRGHPLLQDSGLTDINGEPMLYNDLLRAVHDYFAHNLSETEFGPRGEAAAWRNHMATTNDPLARWALTVETRAQNAWQNFRRGVQDLTLMQRGFADQKASLPPVNFVLTGDAKIDAPMIDYIGTLDLQEKLGSLSPDSALAKKVMAKMPEEKLSLRQVKEIFDRAESIPEPPGVESIRRQWIGGVSGIGDRDPMYDLYRVNGSKKYIQDVQDFLRKELGDDFKGYRLMSNDELEELQTGAIGSQYASFTLNPDIARAFKNIPAYADKTGMSVVEMDLTPEHVAMIGHPGELELVVDYGQGYNPSEVKVVEKYSLRAPDTKEFKQWFGDSKVVDKDGNPLVVYHATPKDFTFFDPRKLTKNTKHPTARLGFFTAVNPESTVEFISATRGIAKGTYDEGANIMPLYASIQNPAVIPSGQFVMQSMALQNMKKKDADKFIDDYLQSLREEGHDGILIEANKTGRGFAGGNEFTSDNWVVLDASQLKSAIGNVGSYGQRVPTAEELKKLKIPVKKAAELQEKGDVRFSLRTYFPTAEEAEQAAYKKAPPDTPEFKRFFGASKVKEEGRPQVMYHGSLNDFSQFNEDNRKGLIFVTPSPAFAEEYALLHASRMEKQAEPPVKVYPLWVRAETPFDYENPVHVDRVMNEFGGTMSMNEYIQTEKEVKEGNWSKIEDPRFVATLKKLGFDSLYVKENRTKNLAVFSANQVKSVTGNIGEFGENKDIRFSLKRFDREDLPTNNKPFTLPENTMLFHGSHETRAKEIEAAGRVLVPSYPIKTSGGTLDEGGLIFFGDKDIAENYANSEADPLSVQAAIEAGEARNPGVVFETVTDRPYRLMSRYHKLTKAEAEKLNRDLGIPDYKRLQSGDSANIAAGRAYTNSRVVPRYKTNKGEMASVWPAIFRSLGFDGFYDNHNVPAVAMTADNGIKLIGDDGRMVKYSLPTFTQATQQRVDETTVVRENKGVVSRILESFAPESLSELRAAFIHRYDRLGFYDKKLAEKMGGKVLLADVSAEAAANMSDLSSSITASVFGIGNRKGGIPVYRNGFTTVDNSVKGVIEILRPLAQFGDPSAYQHYQFWAGVKRGSRFIAEGREENFEPNDIDKAKEVYKKYLAKGVDFNVIQKEMNTFNDGLVNYMIATGVISKEKGEAFKKHMDYIPFFRQIDGEQTVGPKIYNAISGVKPPKKLKGGEAPLTDYLESIVRNAQAAINAGMKNVAAQKALNVAMQLGPQAGAQRLNVIDNAPDTVQVLENGKQVSYRVADPLFINAVKSLNMAEMPFLGILSAPANLLRNLVTKDPGFMLANLARDSLSSWVTSGVNVTPIIGTASNFAKALAGNSPTLTALLNGGILGGYEFSSGLLNSANTLERDLNKKYSEKGSALPLKTFTGIWDALEKGTEASDAATRMAVYDRVLEETGNEAEALYRALEVMNFNRKGNSPVVRILTAAIPFLNARIQGLDVLYRTAFGRNVMENAEAAQKAFFVRGATLMALSAAYFLAVSDDDEWKKQEQETKDNYWIAPGIGKFPTPFEVGFLFKTVPERLLAYTMKDDTGQDLMDSMRRGFLNTFAFNPIPQVAKPLVEYSANYNFFTGRPIVGMGMEGKEPEYQVGPSTTKTAEMIGKSLGLSPLKIDQLISGYTGTMGSYLMLTIDSVLDSQSNSPNASKRFEQLPVVKRFAADPEARGNITQYYELKRAVDAAVETQNYLLKAGKPEEYADFVEKNAGLLAVKSYVSNMEKSMKQLRDMRKVVQGAEMTADEKRDTITAIGQAENNMTQNIQTIKKLVSEYQ